MTRIRADVQVRLARIYPRVSATSAVVLRSLRDLEFAQRRDAQLAKRGTNGEWTSPPSLVRMQAATVSRNRGVLVLFAFDF